MPSQSFNASLKYWPGKISGQMRQGYLNNVQYSGTATFAFSGYLDLANVEISQIKLNITIGDQGGAYTKYFYLRVGSTTGTSLGDYAFTGCFNTTKSITFSSSSYQQAFNVLKNYLQTGDSTGIRVLAINRNKASRGESGSKPYDYDYLCVTALTMDITYTLTKSVGSISSQLSTGSSSTFSIKANDAKYSHKVTWKVGNNTYVQTVDSGKTSTSVSYTIPHSWLPNTVSASGNVTLETLDGTKSLGTNAYNFTVSVPSNIKPTINSFTSSVHANVGSGTRQIENNWGQYIQSYTWTVLELSGVSAGSGATIANNSFSISVPTNNANIYSTSGNLSGTVTVTSDWLERSGTVTFRAKVTDSRGRSETKDCSIIVQKYSSPNFTSTPVIYRCTSTGVKNEDDGTYAKVTASFACSSIKSGQTEKNSISVSKIMLPYPNGTETNITSGTATSALGGGNLEVDNSYTARITLKDAVGITVTYTLVVPSAKYVLHIRNGGNSLGIGKAAPASNNKLSIAWNTDFDSNVDVNGWIQSEANYWNKNSAVDASKANNDVSQGVFPGYYITDKSDRQLSRFMCGIWNDGTISSGFSAINYDTYGNSVGEKSFWLDVDKSGNLTYRLSDPAALRTALGIKYEDVTQSSTVTLNSSGYALLAKPATGTPVFAIVAGWSSTSAATALAVCRGGAANSWYITGNANVSISGLSIRYFFLG